MTEPFDYQKEVAKARKNAARLCEAAGDELAGLLMEREKLDRRILQVRQDLEQFAVVAGVRVEDPATQMGLTDSIRYVLGTATEPLAAHQIKERLDRATYTQLPQDPMPSILTILRRLLKAEEVEFAPGAPGTSLYRWIGGLPPLPPVPKAVGADLMKPTLTLIMRNAPRKRRYMRKAKQE